MSDNDDAQVGRVLSRREVLSLIGVAGAALLVACSDDKTTPTASQPTATSTQGVSTSATAASGSSNALPSCVVSPALTEGPYFVDEKINRSDVRTDPTDGTARRGVPLVLTLNVGQVEAGGCNPLANASVDIWQCDALGVYSDASDPGFNTKGKKFLRGYQMTDGNGKVQFTTIYPGWYQGRATHIHFKIRSGNAEFTSQFFFDDALSEQIYASMAPYMTKGTKGRLQNSGDDIFRQSKGQLTLQPTKTSDGYAASFDIGMQKV